MKTKKLHAKFFCENCGTEVPENARVCKHCGRFFSSVRCPQCGVSGPASMFNKGCPNCGYAMNNIQINSYTIHNSSKEQLLSVEKRKSKNVFNSYCNKKLSVTQNDNSLPVWIYIFTVCILAAVIVAIYSCIK